jgi:carbonic anhydrase-like protein
MDARLNVYGLLGLTEGDAHVIRNAGGVVTPDVIRSLAISQRLLGTREIMLIHHTDCGMLTFTDDGLRAQIEADTGIRPEWAPEAFGDPEADVRQSLARIRVSPFIAHKDGVRGSCTTCTRACSTRPTDAMAGRACAPRGLPQRRTLGEGGPRERGVPRVAGRRVGPASGGAR